MKILYVTVSMPFGADEEFIIAEVNESIRRGHEIVIVQRSPEGSKVFSNDARGLDEISVRTGLFSPQVIAQAGWQAARHPLRLAQILRLLLRSRSLRTLLKNLVVLPKGLWLANLAARRRADHIHVHWATTTATIGLIASEWSGIPWSLTAHRGDVVLNNLIPEKTRKVCFTRYISEMTLKIATELGADVRPGRASVIHIGVELPPRAPDDFHARRDNGPPVLLCPAHMIPVKGHVYLLEAVRRLKLKGVPCTLRLAGRGPLRDEMRRRSEQLSLGATVEFVGHVPHHQLFEWYRSGQVDVVVLPSIDLGDHEHEGIPVCLMEAMAHGIPVVSTTTGGIPELLRDGAGIMVPPQDPAALADAIERLIVARELRRQLGAAGRKRVEEEFSVERVVSQLLDEIEAAGKRGRSA